MKKLFAELDVPKLKKIAGVLLVLVLLLGVADPTILYVLNQLKGDEVVAPVVTAVVEQPKVSFQQYQKGVPFRFVHDNAAHPVVRIMAAGYLAACKDYDLLCVHAAVPGTDTPGVLGLLEQSKALGSSGQLFPIYLPEHYGQANTLIEAGIPVIGVHFPVDKKNVPGLLAWVAPDNVAYAIETAKAMSTKTNCGSPIAITQSSLNDGENAVADNFRKTYMELCPKAEVLPVQIEGFDVPAAIGVASAIIQAHPDLKGAFSTTGNGPQTWAGAAKEMGKAPGEITIISMDYVRANLALVKSGEVYMLVGQPLYEEFYYATVLLLMHQQGLPVPYANVLPVSYITKENVSKYEAINDLAEAVK